MKLYKLNVCLILYSILLIITHSLNPPSSRPFSISFSFVPPPLPPTKAPSCALKAPTGEGYCAILCSAGNENENGLRGVVVGAGQCGPKMTCSPIPNSGGLGTF